MKVSRSRTGRVGRNRPTSRSIYWGLWNPNAMFKFGEQGLWYDPADLTDEKINWRRNLLLNSEQIDIWAKGTTTTVTPNVATAPDGTATGDRVAFSADAGTSDLTQSITTTIGQSCTTSLWLWADAGEASTVVFAFTDTNSASLISQTVNLTTVPTRYSVSGVATTVTSKIRLRCGAGQQGKSFYAWGGQIENGATLGAYQKITDFYTEFLAAYPLHSLFQDNFCVTPLTGPEQTAGYVIDKKAGAARGIEMLSAATVGNPFTSFGDWNTVSSTATLALVGGEIAATIANTNSSFVLRTGNVALTAGLTYEFKFNGRVSAAFASGGIRIVLYNVTTSAVAYNSSATVNLTNPSDFRIVFTAPSTGNYYFIVDRSSASASDNGKVVTLSSASIKQIPGNHASQVTTASRPIWSARMNKCLNYNANPVDLTGVTFTNATNGLATATIVDDTAALAAAGLSGQATSGKVYRIDNSLGNSSAYLVASGSVGNANQHTVSAYGRLISGSLVRVELQGGAGGTTSASTAYTRIATTVTPDTTARGLVMLVPAGAIGHFILNQLEEGALSSRVQTTTGATYDATGWPRYLKFDGVDDWLQTVGSVDMTAGDKLSIFVGAKKLVDGAQGVLIEFSASSGANGTWAMFAPLGSSSVYGSRSLGTTDCLLSTTPTNYPASRGAPDMLTLLGDISAPRQTLRVNGAQYQTTATQGTGNYSNQVVYIGRRGGSSQPFAGNVYGVVVRAAASNDAQIANAERFINKQMGLAA